MPESTHRRSRKWFGMPRWLTITLAVVAVLAVVMLVRVGRQPFAQPVLTAELEREGRRVFRDETFGNEAFWTDTARLHEVVDQDIQPIEALRLGLKVDVDRLNLLKFVLHNPLATSGTRELLRQHAVVGVRATFGADGRIARIGITCAFCHSTVDNALLPGIGHRLDGWPNRTLQTGQILAKLAHFSEPQKTVLRSWPKGTYDPRFSVDGISTPLVLPPAYGLARIKNETYTAEGPISYWNAYVAVTQMHGRGNFSDSRLGINIVQTPDLVTPRLPRASGVPTQHHGAHASQFVVQHCCGRARKDCFRRALRTMPCEWEPHRQQRRDTARALGDRDGRTVRGAHESEEVPDDAPPRPVAACTVFSRRERCNT